MNMKEALKDVGEYCQECLEKLGKCSGEDREICWYYNAQIALIRAIPEKPIIKDKDNKYRETRFYCPLCNRQLSHQRNMKFCPRCGKAINWED